VQAIVLVACVATACASSSASSPPREGTPVRAERRPPATRVAVAATPAPVVVVVMENKNYEQIVGNPDASYLNTFASKGTLLTNMSGITHPSLPNYLAMTSGSTQGCTTDGCPRASYPADNVFHQLSVAGRSWRAWEESMPGPCTLTNSGSYVVHHNPPAYYSDLFPNACPRNDMPYPSTLPTGLRALTFITPNTCNDMHDCSIATGDGWLRSHVPPLLSLGAVVVITFDEGSGGNHIYTAVRGPGIGQGVKRTTTFTHYGLLAGIERHFGLPLLGKAATATAVPL
jgi:hypothetical protein